MTLVRAAGTIPWRDAPGGIEVLIVHRPRYDDWSWPKGKLDPGEDWVEAATRETEEETGWRVRLGIPLPERRYGLSRGQHKVVRYWAARVVGGTGALENEIDEARWVAPDRARHLLSNPSDAEVLDALVRAGEDDTLRTWPLLVVRHAVAVPRKKFDGDDDQQRPLTRQGRLRAQGLVDVIGSFAPQAVVTSPSVRCRDSVQPAADALGLPVQERDGLSEEGYATSPARAAKAVREVLAAGRPAVLCTHRPVLPQVLGQLVALAVGERAAETLLRDVAENGMRKGEVVACQVVGAGGQARIVSAELLES